MDQVAGVFLYYSQKIVIFFINAGHERYKNIELFDADSRCPKKHRLFCVNKKAGNRYYQADVDSSTDGSTTINQNIFIPYTSNMIDNIDGYYLHRSIAEWIFIVYSGNDVKFIIFLFTVYNLDCFFVPLQRLQVKQYYCVQCNWSNIVCCGEEGTLCFPPCFP